MRHLIRPLLFAVARLGLFLAVAAWIIHCRSATVWLHWSIPPCRGLPSGAVVLISPEGLYCRVHGKASFELVGAYLSGGDPYQEEVVFDAMGVKIVKDYQDRQYLIRHWLIVVIMCLFYATLKLIYRRRTLTESAQS